MLLDTCALLWLAQGGGQLSAATCKQINDVPVVYVSAISGFEIGIKVRKGKLTLPVGPVEWFEEIITHHDLHLLLDLAICLQSTTLPAIHADQCDRFIIDGVVKTSIYGVVCPVATRWHTTCIVKTRHRTLLLGVSATLRLPVYLCFYLAIFKQCLDFLRVRHYCHCANSQTTCCNSG